MNTQPKENGKFEPFAVHKLDVEAIKTEVSETKGKITYPAPETDANLESQRFDRALKLDTQFKRIETAITKLNTALNDNENPLPPSLKEAYEKKLGQLTQFRENYIEAKKTQVAAYITEEKYRKQEKETSVESNDFSAQEASLIKKQTDISDVIAEAEKIKKMPPIERAKYISKYADNPLTAKAVNETHDLTKPEYEQWKSDNHQKIKDLGTQITDMNRDRDFWEDKYTFKGAKAEDIADQNQDHAMSVRTTANSDVQTVWRKGSSDVTAVEKSFKGIDESRRGIESAKAAIVPPITRSDKQVDLKR